MNRATNKANRKKITPAAAYAAQNYRWQPACLFCHLFLLSSQKAAGWWQSKGRCGGFGDALHIYIFDIKDWQTAVCEDWFLLNRFFVFYERQTERIYAVLVHRLASCLSKTPSISSLTSFFHQNPTWIQLQNENANHHHPANTKFTCTVKVSQPCSILIIFQPPSSDLKTSPDMRWFIWMPAIFYQISKNGPENSVW
jgi:hypothetical protein